MALTITVNISDDEQKILENDLLDINEWIQQAVAGKINNSKKRMIKEWSERFQKDPTVTTMAATEDGILTQAFADPEYKNRTVRDAEKAAK